MQCKTNTLTANKGTLRYQTWKESEYSPLNLSGKPFFQVTRQKVRQLTSSTSLSSIYPSVSCLYELSFCLALSARLAHTSFSPTFTHPFTSLSAFLLPTSNFLAFSSSRVFLISTNHCRLLSLSPSVSILLSLCSSPAGHFCPVHSLWENNSLWRAGGGVDPMGRVELLWSRSHYQLRGRAGMDKGEEGEAAGGGSRGRKMGGGVQLWVNCMRAPISIRSQLLSDGKKHQYLHLLLTNSHDWAL